MPVGKLLTRSYSCRVIDLDAVRVLTSSSANTAAGFMLDCAVAGKGWFCAFLQPADAWCMCAGPSNKANIYPDSPGVSPLASTCTFP